jgi:hypothetical protein
MADENPGVQARRQQRVAALLLSRYNLRYMVRLYAAFEGDLLLPIVLGEVGLYNVSGLGLDDPVRWPRSAAATIRQAARCAPATPSRSAHPPASPAKPCAARSAT